MEDEINLKCIFKFFWKRKKIVIYIIMAFLILANILFFISNGFVYSNIAKVKMSDEANVNRIASYKDFLLSDTILNSAIRNSNVDLDKAIIRKNLSIDASLGSRIYTITLKHRNKMEGNKLCDFIVSEFVERLESYDGSQATLYDAVVTSGVPINNILKHEITYLIIGCVLSFGYLLSLYFFDKKIKSIGELGSINILGTIDNYKNNLSIIKTKIMLSNLGNVIFLNTAKDINCKNDVIGLVKEFSKDSKVLFIDTNIRNKSKELGYSNLLEHYKEDLSKYIRSIDGFNTMECGTNNNEVEVLLANKNNEKLISELRKKYDYIILYNSNVVDYSDSLIISKLCDCNYMIVEINQTEKKDLVRSLESYKQVNSEVSGIIVIDKEPDIKLLKKFGK